MKLETLLLSIGLSFYLANLLLGVTVHALYFVVFVTALLALLGLMLEGSKWWKLTLTIGALSVLPRYKGGTRQHMVLALLGLVGYGLALI
jgi:hypothetical protein